MPETDQILTFTLVFSSKPTFTAFPGLVLPECIESAIAAEPTLRISSRQ